MKTNDEAMKKGRKLLNEYHELEEALDILTNPDAQILLKCSTFYNHNNKVLKEVTTKLGSQAFEGIREYMKTRMTQIKKELEGL